MKIIMMIIHDKINNDVHRNIVLTIFELSQNHQNAKFYP